MENQYNLLLKILKYKLEKFNLNIEYEFNIENGNSTISIKDNNKNLLSQLVLPESVQQTEEIKFEQPPQRVYEKTSGIAAVYKRSV